MKISRILLLVMFMLCGFCVAAEKESGGKSKLDSFFSPIPDSGKALPRNCIYPKGRLFPFSGFSPRTYSDFKTFDIKLAGPVYGDGSKLLKKCKENGLKAIFPIYGMYKGKKLTPTMLHSLKNNIDWEVLLANIAKTVKTNANNKSIAWWYLQPEELRYWHKNEIMYLQKAVEIIHKNDPQKRPIWMYSPNHRTGQAMQYAARHLDILGKGFYCNHLGYMDNRAWVRWSAEQELKAIKLAGREDNVTPIMCPEMYLEPPADKIHLIPTWVQHDIYSGLVSGMKGVVIFSFWPRKGFKSHKTYYNEYLKLGKELSGEYGLGSFFLFGKALNDLRVTIKQGAETVSCKVKTGKEFKTFQYPSVTYKYFGLSTLRRLVIVNSANKAVSIQITGFPQDTIQVKDLFKEHCYTIKNGVVDMELKPLEVKKITINKGHKK